MGNHWIYTLAVPAVMGLVGWLFKMCWQRIVTLEKDLIQVKLMYVNQHQFHRVVDQQRQDAEKIEGRLDRITEILLNLTNE